AAREGASVTILEHMDRVGRKILSTGNGRCNLTNLSIRPEHYRCSERPFPMRVLDHFSVWDTLTFFDEIGIETRNKGGYIYPNSEQASAVLDALRLEAAYRGVEMAVGCDVLRARKIARCGNRRTYFLVETSLGEYRSSALILSTGSKAAKVTGSDGSGYQLAKAFGHRVIRPLPALVALHCEGKYFRQMAGVRCEAVVKLVCGGKTLAADKGELQLTDYGISGIPVFQVSRFASVALDRGQDVLAQLDFLPSKSMEDTTRFLHARRSRFGYRKSADYLTGIVNKKLAGVLLKCAGIGEETMVRDITNEQLGRLSRLLKCFEAKVTATNSFEQAQVCCGGVDTGQIRPNSMESRLVGGLYFTGEILDVDGICGGYNLQWAWSTGAIAGRCAAAQVRRIQSHTEPTGGENDSNFTTEAAGRTHGGRPSPESG
ncbi:MAG: NAD(P)/FAD-dependent oxidoreductase, partial [Clostridiales bacterium]|nr:NAD(P)/FAD-dependent oxidoreductase [Clostridiales bacterium]